MFAFIDLNIEAMALVRAHGDFNKEVNGRQKLFVGALGKKQWKLFISEKCRQLKPSSVNRKPRRIPFFDHPKLLHHQEIYSWNAGRIPCLSHKNVWYINKWADPNGTIWRSWLTRFSLVWDSFNSTIRIEFYYQLQFYCCKDKAWRYN